MIILESAQRTLDRKCFNTCRTIKKISMSSEEELARTFWTFNKKATLGEFLERFRNFHADQKIDLPEFYEDIVRYGIAESVQDSNSDKTHVHRDNWDEFLAKFGPISVCVKNACINLFDL